MTRTYYTFDLRQTRDLRLRLQIVRCQATDCGRVLHCDKKRGQQRLWCSDTCRARIRNRERKQITLAKHRGIRKRHKGFLGTGHYFWGAASSGVARLANGPRSF
jgi:hypothetical protein